MAEPLLSNFAYLLKYLLVKLIGENNLLRILHLFYSLFLKRDT